MIRNFINYLFIIISVGLTSCKAQNKQLESKDIMGKWSLTTDNINYPQLTFLKDSSAIFTSRGDTVYRFKYYIKSSDLILKDINNVTSKDKIIKLNQDSLVFETLRVNKQPQRYFRKK